MDYAMLLGLGIQAVEAALVALKKSPQTVEQLDNAEAALAELKKFHGTPVTKAQLESLRG